MDPGLAGGIAAAIGVPIVMALLRRAFPARVVAETERPLADLRRDYQKWDLGTIPLYLVSAPVIGYILYRTLAWAGTLLPALLPDATIVLTPVGAVWAIVAIFMGIGAGAIPVVLVTRLMLRERFAEFQQYSARRYGIEPRAYAILLYAYGTVCAIGLALVAGWNVRLTDKALIVNPLWSLTETTHAYSDIESIKTSARLTAPNGNLVSRREYAVRFRDGYVWSTNLEPSDASLARKREVIEYMSERSGVPIAEVDVLRREDVY